MSTLIIDNVDFDMLENQRLKLAEVVSTTPFKAEYQEAMDGLLNMLDDWSDRRAKMNEFVDDLMATLDPLRGVQMTQEVRDELQARITSFLDEAVVSTPVVNVVPGDEPRTVKVEVDKPCLM